MGVFGISKRRREEELLTALRERDKALGELFVLHEAVQDEIDALAELGKEESERDLTWDSGRSHGFRLAGEVLALAVKQKGPFNVPKHRPSPSFDTTARRRQRGSFVHLDNNPQA
jgi:hypothetical protein